MSEVYTLRFDGACWPNPDGRASYGYTIVHKSKKTAEGHGIAGDGPGMSNNFAEFYALYKGLERLFSFKYLEYGSTLRIIGDSQLVVKMLNKKNPKPKNDRLYYPAFIITLEQLNRAKQYFNVCLEWVPRKQNTDADNLSKIDQLEICPYENKA